MRQFTLFLTVLTLAISAFADTYRVHYSVRGSGRDVTVQAESSAEARGHGDVPGRGRHRRPPNQEMIAWHYTIG